VTAENLLLITIDALRHDALGCVGSTYASTPNLDALARDGVLFEQAIANGPRTQSSFPSIMSSLYPLVAGERRRLPRDAATLAEVVSRAGLATAGLNPSNPFLTRETGYQRGFGLFIDFWDAHDRTGLADRRKGPARLKSTIHDAIGRRSLGLLMLLQAALLEEGGQYLTGRLVADQALSWLSARRGRFFLWLHLMDAHYPYQPLPAQRSPRDRAAYLLGAASLLAGRPRPAIAQLGRLYGRRVELVDDILGEVIRGLDRLGLSGSTTVVVTSDHGEQIGERGRWAHGPDLHDELIRVPLILRGPGLDPGRRIDHQVELLGLGPTLLELAGIEEPASFLGTSFAGLARTGRGAGSPVVFSEAMHSGGRQSRSGATDRFTVTSCRGEGWKYILDSEVGAEELYDLASDPGELRNLAGLEPATSSRFRRLVEDHRARCAGLASSFEAADEPGTERDDAEMRRRLASLGYL
jgi:arylsulfatase A-like enzyme